MTSPLTHSYLRKLLLVSFCLVFGAGVSHAQNVNSESVQQEIERLQRILELQRELDNLRAVQAEGAQAGGGQTLTGQRANGVQTTQTPQTTQVPYAQPQPTAQLPQAPIPAVSFKPVDTGRSAVSFTIGKPAANHDRYAVKINVLYGAGLMAPNIGFDMGLGRRTTIGLWGGYSDWHNMWDFSAQGPEYDPTNSYRRRLDHIAAGVEFRYWLRERFEGHFLGVNALWSQFTVGEAKVPPLFQEMYENEGFLYGGGLTYGYLWQFAQRWGVEFTIGAGVAIVEHDEKTINFANGSFSLGEPERFRKTFVGPTSAGITIVFKM